MNDFHSGDRASLTHGVRPSRQVPGTVTDIATRRAHHDIVESITLVFDGVHYGTFPVRIPYARDNPITLYVVPSRGDADSGASFGPLSCLITDDPNLAATHDLAR